MTIHWSSRRGGTAVFKASSAATRAFNHAPQPSTAANAAPGSSCPTPRTFPARSTATSSAPNDTPNAPPAPNKPSSSRTTTPASGSPRFNKNLSPECSATSSTGSCKHTYADTVPLPVLKREQDRVLAELAPSNRHIGANHGDVTDAKVHLDDTLTWAQDSDKTRTEAIDDGKGSSLVRGVELGGFEPPTFSLRTRRATNCAIAPGAGLILASSPVVLASSVAVSPPTAPEPRYDRDEDHRPPYSPAARRPSRMASRSMGWKSSSSSSTGAGM